ncbi:MAG: hypothetical protein JWN80_899 [Microbacteriaceae bacterium]|jgi:hypothetical protein|nr:hypothetical protein [Microbacteriaceae bacterium]
MMQFWGFHMGYQGIVSRIGKIHTGRKMRVTTALLGALVVVAGFVLAQGATPATAATPLVISQCNYDSNTPGLLISCDVTVNNYFNSATGAMSSSTVVKACRGAANTAPSSCTVSTLPATFVVTSVNQCNNSVNGGGSTLACSVTIVNNITGTIGLSGFSVNQCIGTGGGGGTSTTICNPIASTTSATVTQCNGSANGGGGDGRVICTVNPGDGSALPVGITQCNGSANGGGSTVTCSSSVRNIFTAAAVAPPARGSAGSGGTATSSAQVATGASLASSKLTSDDRAFGEIAASHATVSSATLRSERALEHAAAVEAAAAAAAAASRAAVLAFTGANATVAVALALLTALAGTVLVLLSAVRRRLAARSNRPAPRTARA